MEKRFWEPLRTHKIRLGHRNTKNTGRLGHRDTKNADRLLGHKDIKNADNLGHRDTETVDIINPKLV